MTLRANVPPEQLVLELPHRAAQEAEDFLVSRSNTAAVELVDTWPGWPLPTALVVGPAGAGKSHIANVWRLRSGADVITAGRLDETAVGAFEARRALVVEDIERGVGSEQVLFHLLNLAREKAGSILLTSRVAPGEIEITLPDLRSRLRAIPPVFIETPDEDLIRSVLVKLFADRQLVVEPHVVSHIARHMDRSMAAALEVVAACDRLSLAMQRKVTRAVAAAALAEVGKDADDDQDVDDGGPG
ncbi:DnaA/Hda family protein [Hyphomicrobium sp. CS1GBMeth3]|uniref:DnaA ATPase domain-containing protein n=1 Tax=Hyphomicrobium sp. CS1GBMeth3 TaxID=1892845 RepID=UPI0009314528|nr:DnaA/Hda family protein [Hyphomicrobium sp. CS1GBMeth3]